MTAPKAAHTPENWRVDDNEGDIYIEAGAGELVALVPTDKDLSHETRLSRARLIAAAPEMAELLRHFSNERITDSTRCHVGICSAEECNRCRPILEAQRLLARIDGTA